MAQPPTSASGLLSRFREVARQHGDKVAVRAEQTSIDYQTLEAWSDQLAQRLVEAGLQSQQVVALLASPSPATIAAMLAIIKVNGIYLPLSRELPEQRIRYMLDDADAVLLLDPQAQQDGRAYDRPRLALSPYQPDNVTPAPLRDCQDQADDCLYIMYTSGSTGQPKGVRVPHRGVLRLVDPSNDYARFNSSRVFLQLAPLSFDASTLEIWGPLLNGGCCVIYPHSGLPEPRQLAAVLRREQVTTLWLTAALFNWLIDNDALRDLPLQELLVGGEALSVPHVRKAQQVLPTTQLINGYGPTETTTFACCYRIPRPLPENWQAVPIGEPIARSKALVIDEQGRPLPPGERGELYIGGDGVALGYQKLADLTAAKFRQLDLEGEALRCYATGDLVVQDEQGLLHFEGRVDDQVKIAGHRIEPAELNHQLLAHEAVREAFSTVGEVGGQAALISYVAGDAQQLQAEGLQEFLRERLPHYMLPSRILVLERLPLNANGKVDRRALPRPETQDRKEVNDKAGLDRDSLRDQLAALWCRVLGRESVAERDNFFAVGGNSLRYMDMVTLANRQQLPLRALDVFEHPSFGELLDCLTARLQQQQTQQQASSQAAPAERAAIAIIGMAGRFPGADSVAELWEKLCAGEEGISYFSLEELEPGEQARAAADPDYVRARGVINNHDHFDAEFFGVSAREAAASDPQQRVFLEECWTALEAAGYFPSPDNRIGVFAGVGHNAYYLQHVLPRYGREGPLGELPTQFVNDKDYIATRSSYKLNLRGPSLSINTACSTSLVAVVEAVKSLRAGDCELALAGGVSLQTPMRSGYLYQEGGMLSRDGKTRPFDRDGSGTTFNSGAAVVVLKPLADAERDGDHIHAVIRGVALNNDGAHKASFTAPSVRGQAEVVEAALRDAGVSADSICFVEAHGTATPLGDPIEVQALQRAYSKGGSLPARSVALGSVKSNLGHLVAAAGATGLIKASLSLQHRLLPATLHYQAPNPHINFAQSPFYVAAQTLRLEEKGEPLRAGVSSFGVGGTNAHVIVEQPPTLPPRPEDRRPQLFTLSAKSPVALQAYAERMATALGKLDAADFADATFSCQVSRSQLPHKTFVVAETAEQAAQRLACAAERAVCANQAQEMVWLFSGQGSQCLNMGRELYEQQALYRRHFDHCADLFKQYLDCDLRDIVFADDEVAQEQLRQTRFTQPALFSLEYALAQLWLSLGLQPAAMIGHSIGEFSAAAIAGIFNLEDAVRVVATRAEAMQSMSPGSMLVVHASAEAVTALLDGDTEIAAFNAPALTVVSGPQVAIERLAKRCSQRDIETSLLPTSHAFHSCDMEPAADILRREMSGIAMQAPSIPIVSTATGEMMSADEACSPDYWASQMCLPVRFSEALAQLNPGEQLLLEVGPRAALTRLTQANLGKRAQVYSSGLDGKAGEYQAWLKVLGLLWQQGQTIDWRALHAAYAPRRIPLASYPFQRQRYWIDALESPPAPATEATIAVVNDAKDSKAKDKDAEANATVAQAAAPMSSAAITEERMHTDAMECLKKDLVELFEDCSGEIIEAEDFATEFFELGFDSLFLTQAVSAIKQRYGVQLPFRRLLQDLASVDSLAEHLAGEIDMSQFSPTAAQSPGEQIEPAPQAPEASQAAPVISQQAPTAPNSELATVMSQQLQIIQQQLQLLGANAAAPLAKQPAPGSVATDSSIAKGSAAQNKVTAARPAPSKAELNQPTDGAEGSEAPKPFGAQARIERKSREGLDPERQACYQAFFDEYLQATRKSRDYTQAHRAQLADPRAVSGFRPEFKEIIYPIVTKAAQGCTLWDVDGNEYIDMTSGYGSNFFGFSAPFVVEAMKQQLDRGIDIGPQSDLAGPLAEKIAQCVGMDRVAFCNTGSEAVMGAIRIARTVTARKLIVSFSGGYHGIFDEVVVRGTKKGRTVPAAAGIEPESVQNVLVLDWDDPKSLESIRERGEEIAAVLVEPVQSRNPDRQPREFLQALRELTREIGSALIFDEVVTGFRTALGGAQAYFGIRADLATYGKVLGGGLSIGVIAGAAEYMGALDGGCWQYGDDSKPEMGVTYFAGTFVRHPLALAAANAVIDFLRAQPDDFYPQINARAARFANKLNRLFERRRAPLHVEQFCSVMYLRSEEDNPDIELFYADLRLRGVHVWPGRPMFLTLAHSEELLEQVVERFEQSLVKMQGLGFVSGLSEGQADLPPAAAARLGRDERGSASWFVPAADSPSGYARLAADKSEEPVSYDPFAQGELEAVVDSTEAQRELWLAAQMGEGANCAFNESVTLHLRGELNRRALDEALQDLLARHDSLRACFSHDGRQLLFRPELRLPLKEVDLSGAGQQQSYEEALERAVSQPFDLADGPLLRCQLFRISATEHRLLVTAHHSVCDGWSIYLLLQNLGRLYSQFAGGESLPVGASSFVDYAKWERSEETRAQREASLAYWREQLQADAPFLELPLDKPRPPLKSYNAQRVDRAVAEDFIPRARQLATRNKVSLNTVLIAGFAAFAARLSGQKEVLFALPFAGQMAKGDADLVGHCVNALPFKVSVDSQASFASLLRQVHERMSEAFEHQYLTFGTLLQSLDYHRDPSRPALLSTLFNADINDESPWHYHGLEAELESNPRRFEIFDMNLNITVKGASAVFECTFNTDLWYEHSIQSRLAELEQFFFSSFEGAEQAVSGLNLLPAEEQQTLANFSAGPQQALPVQDCASLLSLGDFGARPAVSCARGELSYAELDERANRLANYLLDSGLQRGELVGVLLPRSSDMLVTLLAIWRAGAAYVPMDPGFPLQRLRYMAQAAQLKTIISESDQVSALAENARCICIDQEAESIAACDASLPKLARSGEDPAYVIFTSGSTGKPKGVQIPQRAVVNFLLSMAERPGLQRDDKLLALTTLSFDIAVLELYLPLLQGAQVVIADREASLDGRQLAELLAKHQVNVMQATPSTWRLLLAAGWEGDQRLKALCGGEALAPDLARQLQPRVAELWNMYGPTEATVWCACHRVREEDLQDNGPVPVGAPIANTQLHVLDKQGAQLPLGAVGELYIGGECLATAYLQQVELTAERFIDNPRGEGKLYRSGDQARWRADGALECLGRLDSQIKLRGFRIELGEIEASLASHPEVVECAAAVRRYGDSDHRLVAYARLAAGKSLNSTEMRRYLRDYLPDYMIPQLFMVVEALPLTANGKVDRAQLPDPMQSFSAEESRASAPRSEVEVQLASIWGEILQHESVKLSDMFFDVGGHSLLALDLINRVQERFNVRITPLDMLVNTFEQLAAKIEATQEAGGLEEAPEQEDESGELNRRKPGLFARLLERPLAHAKRKAQWTLSDD